MSSERGGLREGGYTQLENAKSGVFLQLSMTLGIHPHRQDITYTNSESPAAQHSSNNYRTFQISQVLLKPSGFLSVQVGGREVGRVKSRWSTVLGWRHQAKASPRPQGAPRLSEELL